MGGAAINQARAMARSLLPPEEAVLAFPALIPADGVTANMEILLAAINGGGLMSQVGLWTNNIVPSDTTTYGNFVLATAAGLLAVALGVGTFQTTDAYGRSIWQWPQNVFTAAGGGLPQIAYGYVVSYVSPLSNLRRVGWCQKFQNPQVCNLAGDQIKFTLSLGGRQC